MRSSHVVEILELGKRTRKGSFDSNSLAREC
jgi:hypothetical protein